MGRNKAVALEYEGVNELPRVVASGVGEIARQIIKLAQENNIPIHNNTELTELLSKIPSGTEISPDTFRLVAEVLCFLNFSDAELKAVDSTTAALHLPETNTSAISAE